MDKEMDHRMRLGVGWWARWGGPAAVVIRDREHAKRGTRQHEWDPSPGMDATISVII